MSVRASVAVLVYSRPTGILDELKKAHVPLAELHNERAMALASVQELTELIADRDQRHDHKARAMYRHLEMLVDGSDELKQIERYQQIERRLFPVGLRVVQLAYGEEGGAAVALEQSLDDESHEQLDAITVGSQTLADLLADWLDAGHALGDAVRRRAELRASLARDGSAVEEVDVRAGRKQWMQAVVVLRRQVSGELDIDEIDDPVDVVDSEDEPEDDFEHDAA